MKKYFNVSIFITLFLCFSPLFVYNRVLAGPPPPPPILTTMSATSVTATSATLNADITFLGMTPWADVNVRGFYFGLTNSYGTTITQNGLDFPTGDYSADISSLTCGTLYHFEGYAINEQGPGVGGDQTFTTPPCNSAPVASNVTISGTPEVGQTLTGSYTYFDADNDLEGASTFQWFQSGTAIPGATSTTYVPVLADLGASITFEVTPVAQTGTSPGVSAISSNKISILNSAPVASNVTISGTPEVGQTLTGSYTYFDADNDLEGASTFQWYRNQMVILGATSTTYTTTLADSGSVLTFEVIPVAQTGTSPGIAVQSSALSISTPIVKHFSGGGIISLFKVPPTPTITTPPAPIPTISSPTPTSTGTPKITTSPIAKHTSSPTTEPKPTPVSAPIPEPTPTPISIPNPAPIVPEVTPPTLWQSVEASINESFNTTKQIAEAAYQKGKTAMGQKEVSLTVRVIITLGVIAGAVFSILPTLFVNPLSFSEVVLIPFRLWSLFLMALGIKKRNRPWGVVYDSVTKQPLDPAYVVLKDENGKEVASSITDLDGRYGFLMDKGNYTLEVHKTDYKFPSERLRGHISDELYQNLYQGEVLTVGSSSEVIDRNVPMDPINFNWNEFAKRQQRLNRFYSRRDFVLNEISSALFAVGAIISILALFLAPRPYNTIIFGLYVILFFVGQLGIKSKDKGTILQKENNLPLPFSIIRIFSEATNTEVAHKISDRYGRFYCLVPNGNYFVKIDKKLEDGNYETVLTTGTIEVKKGLINKKFEI